MSSRVIRRPAVLYGFAAAVLAVAAVTGLYIFNDGQAGAISLRPDDGPSRDQGRSIYSEYCAACHGISLQGQPDWQTPLANGRYPAPPHNKDGHTWHHPDELLFKLTKFGSADVIGNGHQSDMPAFKDQLSDWEIIAVLSFIKSTWPKIIRIRHDRLNGITQSRKETAK